MMHRRRGAIVNISSLSAVSGVAGQTAYAASKAALLGLTRALAREVGRRGVRVNAVLPGFVATDMTASLPEDVVRALRAHECLPRGTSAADVGEPGRVPGLRSRRRHHRAGAAGRRGHLGLTMGSSSRPGAARTLPPSDSRSGSSDAST